MVKNIYEEKKQKQSRPNMKEVQQILAINTLKSVAKSHNHGTINYNI